MKDFLIKWFNTPEILHTEGDEWIMCGIIAILILLFCGIGYIVAVIMDKVRDRKRKRNKRQ